jgi:hypothetical protein
MDTTQQCQAHSRSGKQCGNLSVKGKRVCKLHGGWSTGPKTEEGIERIRQGRTKHGRYSAKAMKERLDFRLLMLSCKNELKEVTELMT